MVAYCVSPSECDVNTVDRTITENPQFRPSSSAAGSAYVLTLAERMSIVVGRLSNPEYMDAIVEAFAQNPSVPNQPVEFYRVMPTICFVQAATLGSMQRE